MKFLHVCAVFPPTFAHGGVPQAAFGLAEALVRRGHENLVLTTDADGQKRLAVPKDQVIDYKGVKVLYVSRLANNSYFYSPSLGKNIRRWAPAFDVALIRGNWGYVNFAARTILPDLKIPFLLYPEGSFSDWAIHHKRLKKIIYWHFIEKINYSKAAGVVALTAAEYSQIKTLVPDIPVEVIPNGINLEEFYPLQADNDLQARFPNLVGKPFILFLSRLHTVKGVDLLLSAFARMVYSLERITDAPVLVVAGYGQHDYEEKVRKFAVNLGIEKLVYFPGKVTGLNKLLLFHNCSFFVLPSRSEGFPIAVLEAMACGKPVLLTRTCNLPEVQEYGAGLNVEPNSESLAEGMMRIWQMKEKGAIMGAYGLKLIKDKFTWDAVADKTSNFCKRIVTSQNKGVG